MTYEWTKLETNIFNDNRTRMLFEQLGLNGIGAYVLLRSIIGTKGKNGASRDWIERAIEPFGFRKTFKDVLTHFNLFGYNDDLLVVALPLTDDSSEEPSCATQRSASCETQGCETRGCTTPESSLRDNSLKEREKRENLERERGELKFPQRKGLSPLSQKFSKKNFIPPTVEEVTAYCTQKGYFINAERFVSYYESTNWYIKDTCKMKDWKAAVRTWVNREKEKAQNDPANRRDKNIPDSSYIPPYDGYLPPNAPPRPTPTAVWDISTDAWIEISGPNRLKPIVGMNAFGT